MVALIEVSDTLTGGWVGGGAGFYFVKFFFVLKFNYFTVRYIFIRIFLLVNILIYNNK